MTSVETVLNYFSQVRKFYANELNKRLKDINLTPNEISILVLLSKNKTINTSSQLKMMLGVSKGLVSRSIDSLVNKGFIVCIPDSSDKRIQRIHLQEAAIPVIQRLKQEGKEISDEILFDIDPEEFAQVERLMKKILNRISSKEGVNL